MLDHAPRDNLALAFMEKTLGTDVSLLNANDEYNSRIAGRLSHRLLRFFPPQVSVSVLGLSYKPNSLIFEYFSGLPLAKGFADAGCRARIHNRLAKNHGWQVIEIFALSTEDLREALNDADIVLVTTTVTPYKNLPPANFDTETRPIVLVNVWRI